MKALLCSNFRYMGKFFLPHLNLDSKKELNILFITYALDNEEYMNQNKKMLLDNLNIKNFIELQPEYGFEDEIEVIFVIGGITDNLIEKLFEYKQFEKIKELILEKETIYIAESAGCDFAGDYINYDLYEGIPRKYSLLKKYGENVFDGLRLINKMIITHASEYRIRILNNGQYCRIPYSKKFVSDYLKTIALLDESNIEYETIGNNEALLIKDDNYEKISYDWSKFPIKEVELSEYEKKLQNQIKIN